MGKLNPYCRPVQAGRSTSAIAHVAAGKRSKARKTNGPSIYAAFSVKALGYFVIWQMASPTLGSCYFQLQRGRGIFSISKLASWKYTCGVLGFSFDFMSFISPA